jgi:hypothetical protein
MPRPIGAVKKQQRHTMREHAARLSALATSAREEGNIELAENLTRCAVEVLERSDAHHEPSGDKK